MTEGQWIAAQEKSLPGLTTVWTTLLVSFLPAFSWIVVNLFDPK